MPNNVLGDLRRSAVVSTFGPGAIVDYRVGDAPVSAVTAGLEEWDRRSPPAGVANKQTVFEPRLQERLGVSGFRLPPVDVDDDNGRANLPAVRFPNWLQCPECHLLKPSDKWAKEPGDPRRVCGTCTSRRSGGKKVYAIPVRFVTACEKGHLEEFPWHFWVQHRSGCTEGQLTLESEGAGLAGLILQCKKCKARRSMEGVFSREALKALHCGGRRPWLASEPENGCTARLVVVQRGASNLYFPITVSALDIPPWSDNIQKQLGQYWDALVNMQPEHRGIFVAGILPSLDLDGVTADELVQLIDDRLGVLKRDKTPNLRHDEYEQFTSGRRTPTDSEVEFEVRPERVPGSLVALVDHLVRAVRLREVRAISGFTRINPPSSGPDSTPSFQAPLSVKPMKWLPAIEVRGEGIFIALNSERLRAWEAFTEVRARAERVRRLYEADWHTRFGSDVAPDRTITPRFLLVHALAHALIRQLALECGYSSASLRERVYVSDASASPAEEMCGLLLYTATTDADGTLGGLARQGRPDRFERIMSDAIRALQWCSADPLCIEEMASAQDSWNLAACHSCVLVSETSCEEFNRFLDRALLVGTPSQPHLGFFRDLCQQ